MLTDQLRFLPTGCIAGFGVATRQRPSWQVHWNAYELCTFPDTIKAFRAPVLTLEPIPEPRPRRTSSNATRHWRPAISTGVICKNHVHQILTQLWVPIFHIPVKSTASIHPTSFHARVQDESVEYLLGCFILALPSFNHLELRQNWARPSVPVWPTSASGGAWSWSEAFEWV